MDFYCKALSCSMSFKTCVNRQQANLNVKDAVYPSCVNCAEGKKNISEHGEIEGTIKVGGEMADIKYKCSIEGCGRAKQKDGLCYIHFKEKNGEVPYPRKEAIKKSRARSVKATSGTSKAEPAPIPETPRRRISLRGCHSRIGEEPAIAPNDGSRTLYLAQLLYVSDLLDGQINTAHDTGRIDPKIIIDIRGRLGAVLRESAGSHEAL